VPIADVGFLRFLTISIVSMCLGSTVVALLYLPALEKLDKLARIPERHGDNVVIIP
jgi:hypothetical protein